METYFIIYKTTCMHTNKYYIGMHTTKNLQDGYLGSGKILKRSLNKYGKENHIFEIIESLPDKASLIVREREIVNAALLLDELCMNLKVGGEGGFSNLEHAFKAQSSGGKQNIENIRSIHFKKLKEDAEYKQKWISNQIKSSSAIGAKLDNGFFGKKHSSESSEKMKRAKEKYKGEKHPQFGYIWISNPEIGTKKIPKEELGKYLQDGWIKGRK